MPIRFFPRWILRIIYTQNVAGRRLVGLRYWNTVDDDGESYWVFESRDPSVRSNPIDSKYVFYLKSYRVITHAFPAFQNVLGMHSFVLCPGTSSPSDINVTRLQYMLSQLFGSLF